VKRSGSWVLPTRDCLGHALVDVVVDVAVNGDEHDHQPAYG